MALINCPNCSRRISSLAKVCSHCQTALGEVSAADLEKMAIERWKTRTYRALNISYIGLTLAVVGAIWWFVSGDPGWGGPIPYPAVSVAALGAVVYVFGRSWVWWLRFNKPKSQAGGRR